MSPQQAFQPLQLHTLQPVPVPHCFACAYAEYLLGGAIVDESTTDLSACNALHMPPAPVPHCFACACAEH